MSIPLEKILTTSAGDYCKSKGKDLSDYEMVGVHGSYSDDNPFLGPDKLGEKVLYEFLEKIPYGTEVVVDYKTSSSQSKTFSLFLPDEHYSRVDSGTALIPKKKTTRS